VTVDGTDFKIPRQRPHARDQQFYSHKFRHAAYRYEVAVCIQTGLIVWYHGPFPAGKWPDINIFRKELKHLLLPGEMVEADRGYKDLSCRHCDVVVSKSDARAKSRAMRRHETMNADLKCFECLNRQWRHTLDKHILAFASCALLVQMKYKLEGGPKFYCKY
jgi:DDE superfamily endonuclease